MTWEEQLAALETLEPVLIRMRAPGNWFVALASVGITVEGGAIWNCLGEGATLELAVRALWQRLTTVTPPQRVLVDAYRHPRAVRWSGTAWEPIPEP